MPNCEKKKKIFFEMPSVSEFISKQAEETQKEYHDIVLELETRGYLNKPTGEKIERRGKHVCDPGHSNSEHPCFLFVWQ